MQSTTIVLNEWLWTKPLLDAPDIAADLASYGRKAAFARAAEVVGWHAKAEVPKFEMGGIAPGSVFLFSRAVAAGSRVSEIERISALLTEVEERGIGERREEGFGEVRFCDPVHLDLLEGS